MKILICHLYPELMNLYGDRGNIISFVRRAEWMGVTAETDKVTLGEERDFSRYDILFVGGGQDREQRLICVDFQQVKGKALAAAIESGAVTLAVCGGYQLLGKYYKTGAGEVLNGIGVLDAWTVAGTRRLIGNVVIESGICGEMRTIVGFENHSGQTFLGPGAAALGKVRHGFGNNGQDGLEGCVYKNCVGTYLHGSLLPKNPWLTDHLIKKALERKYGEFEVPALDDALEARAHEAAIRRARQRPGV
ncbi:MAG: glutamine amidotransferase [Bacillota bacterium]|nr:glutamine amidotransferase [Bacillota bacterium]